MCRNKLTQVAGYSAVKLVLELLVAPTRPFSA